MTALCLWTGKCLSSILASMPKFKVETSSKHSAEQTYQKIKVLLETDKELRKLDTYTCEFDDQKLSGSAKGAKFQADMKVSQKSEGTAVEIDVSLPLMLTPLKGVVQSTLQKKLQAALA